ncbi:MAG: hypothetical protein LBU16_02650 [Treponema sp.]|jgi:hypothetical protein|nr:hypothetical protein [Treponema sp.]
MSDLEQRPVATPSAAKAFDDAISLIDLIAVLWHRKVMITAITLAAAVGVVVFSVVSLVLPPESSLLPNEYTPRPSCSSTTHPRPEVT